MDSQEKSPTISYAAADAEIDLSTVKLAPNLSHMDLHEGDKVFSATIDLLDNTQPSTIITKVLQANGYEVNLENCLACLDSFRVTYRVRWKKKPANSPIAVLPAISFQLPQNKPESPWLQMFYNEITGFAQALANARTKQEPKGKKDSLNHQVERLGQENRQLQAEIKRLSKKISALENQAVPQKNSVSINQAAHVHLGKIKLVDARDRLVVIRVDRKNYKVPYNLCRFKPRSEQRIVAALNDGVITAVLQLDPPFIPVTHCEAEILFVEGTRLRVRTIDRQIHEILLSWPEEIRIAKRLRRHQRIMMQTVDDQIVGLQTDADPRPSRSTVYTDALKDAEMQQRLKNSEAS